MVPKCRVKNISQAFMLTHLFLDKKALRYNNNFIRRFASSGRWKLFNGRNISNLRYADDSTLMAESEEELKSLLMKVKEESEKVGDRKSVV